MASQISPGVIVKERDLTTGTVVNSAATNAAVVSTFQKGPVGEITQISSQRELVDTFGLSLIHISEPTRPERIAVWGGGG